MATPDKFSQSTTQSSQSQPISSVASPSNFSAWSDAIPKRVDSEDAVGAPERDRIWAKMYEAAGMRSANEKERLSLRAAVYVYCCKNGTSREGQYAGDMVLSTGATVPAAVIPRATGRMKIRKFMRANMDESYQFFKETRVMELDPRFVSKAADHGISPECAFAVADWMDDCPHFTPVEQRAHGDSFVHSIERARRAREGKSLESVEGTRNRAALTANGPNREDTNTTTEW